MLKGFAQRQLSRGMLFGPLLVGVVYGFVLTFVPRGRLDFFYVQSPFVFAALAGVAMAFACRPVLLRIEWATRTAMGVAVGLVAGIGPLGDWAIAALIDLADLGAFPLNLPESGLALLLGACTAGVLMGWLFHPAGGTLNARALWLRWRFYPWAHRLVRLAGIAAVAVVMWLVLAALDARQEEAARTLYVPLVEPNYWLRLQGIWLARGSMDALGASLLLVALLWLRAVLLLVALLPVAMAVRGSWAQLTLVFTVLLFVLGEFAPLMMDQPYPSLTWLLMRTGLGLGRAFVLSALLARLFGVIRRDAGARAPTGPT